MCLAVPGNLIKNDGSAGVVELGGNRVEVSTALVPHAQVGDWVLVHAGFAIQRLDPEAAAETRGLLGQLEDLR